MLEGSVDVSDNAFELIVGTELDDMAGVSSLCW